jgi:hypothetical protein
MTTPIFLLVIISNKNKIDRVIIGVGAPKTSQLRVNPVTEKFEEFTAFMLKSTSPKSPKLEILINLLLLITN